VRDQLDHALALVLVVLDDEEALHRLVDELLDLVERFLEPFLRDRLLEICHGARLETLLSLVDPSVPGNPPSGIVPVGILMTDTYGAGSAYIQALRTWQFANDGQLAAKQRLRLLFSNVSFVGANALAERLKAAGITDGQIARIKAPIGLAIGAQTPAEVALSVMAEIVLAVRGVKRK
jgi:hypothetical protein